MLLFVSRVSLRSQEMNDRVFLVLGIGDGESKQPSKHSRSLDLKKDQDTALLSNIFLCSTPREL
jgi:hypothetical protein